MPRRGSVTKRDVLQDPIYNSKLVTRLINNVMFDGKKGIAQKKDCFASQNSLFFVEELLNEVLL